MERARIQTLFQLAAQRAADFRSHTAALKQRPLHDYGEMLALFDEALPQAGEEGPVIVTQMADLAEQGLMMATGPRFFGWVIGSSHPVGVAADMLASAYGQNVGNHQASPAASACETISARWLLEILDLPRTCSVGFVSGATVANTVCLAAARGEVLRRAGWDADAQGLFGAPPITVLIGDDAHATVFSALQFLGLGHDRVIRVKTDRQGTIDAPDFLRLCMDVRGPTIAILQAGQINTGDFDPFPALIAVAHSVGAWVHVDGAFGLWARASAALKPLSAGIDLADSWATDGHKWLQTPYDCGYAIVRHELAHRRAMTIAASYLPTAGADERDPSHYVLELSRRARGFATWAVIKALGAKGIADMVERHCAIARSMADALVQEPGVTVVNQVRLNQFIVRFGNDLPPEAGDALTQETIKRIQAEGICFAGGAKWRERQVMRVSVIGFDTDQKQGRISTEAMLKSYREARAGLTS